MAKILCAYSGIEFSCDHVPISLTSREYCHPIFTAKQSKLLSYAVKWKNGKLDKTDSYLLFTALLHSTDLVEFRIAARKNDTIVAACMEELIKTVGAINIIVHPAFNLPHFVISPDTASLLNVHYWLQSWQQCIADFKNGYKEEKLRNQMLNRERGLERLIRTTNRDIHSYARLLADWAEIAAEFPQSPNLQATPFGPLTLADYWKQIIIKCGAGETIFAIPEKDLDELIEHCEEAEFLHGSSAAQKLMEHLRESRGKQRRFMDLGDVNIKSGTYQILSGNDTVEDANKLAMIMSAPETDPKLTDYPSRLAWLKAKSNYDLAQRYKAEQAAKSPQIDNLDAGGFKL
jgi:hypothetical protein